MLDYTDFNFDLDGDGILDSFAAEVDMDGDGINDALLVDTDCNGMEDMIIQGLDLDNNGIIDTVHIGYDTNSDGVIDTYSTINDGTYENGIYGENVNEYDTNGDGIIDEYSTAYDSNGDGIIDTIETFFDLDGDGVIDTSTVGQLLDTDADGIFDTYVEGVDENGDGIFDIVEVYDYDNITNTIELESILSGDEDTNHGLYIDDLENFDPDQVDPGDVIGDPDEAMAEWEFQGDTNRCALYSQKFIIDEMTGEDINIEEIADLAEENGWFSEDGGTPLTDMNQILNHFGIRNEMSFGNDLDDLKDCLANGGKAIVSIDADEIWYGENDDIFTPDDGANHAVEVIGIDNSDPEHPMIILNDSGNPDGCGEMIPADTFIDAWEDGGCQMIDVFNV